MVNHNIANIQSNQLNMNQEEIKINQSDNNSEQYSQNDSDINNDQEIIEQHQILKSNSTAQINNSDQKRERNIF